VSVPFAARVAELLDGIAALAGAIVPLGPAAGAPLAVAGLVALTLATRNRRALAIAGTALVGALAAVALRGFVAAHLGVGAAPGAIVLALAGAGAGAATPAIFPFAAAALPGALLGAQLPLAGRAAFGAAAGALLAGAAGLALSRYVAAAFASACGGLLVAVGVLAAFGRSPLARDVAGRPAAIAGLALVLAVAGVAFQATTTREDPAARSPGSPP
jgi:hypothetical protein